MRESFLKKQGKRGISENLDFGQNPSSLAVDG